MPQANIKKLGQEGFGELLESYIFQVVTVVVSSPLKDLNVSACVFCCSGVLGTMGQTFPEFARNCFVLCYLSEQSQLWL